jgi:hypothetical protein
MDVSIIIVSYNVSRFLAECLASIDKETSCTHEVIVVDNNSSDDSVAIAKAHRPPVKLIQNASNVGFARANNMGFKEASGRYIFMLNPDTVVLDHAVDTLVRFMEKNPGVGACGPKNVNPDLSLQRNCHHFPTLSMILVEYLRMKRRYAKHKFFGREHMTYWNYDEIKEVDWISGASLMLRRQGLEQAGGLDEDYFMYSEESDLCFQLKKLGWKTVFVPSASILHYGGQSSLSQKKQSVHKSTITRYLHQSRYIFFKKNYGKARELMLRMVDILYFSFSYMKNMIQVTKKDRQERMAYARVVLRLALGRP